MLLFMCDWAGGGRPNVGVWFGVTGQKQLSNTAVQPQSRHVAILGHECTLVSMVNQNMA